MEISSELTAKGFLKKLVGFSMAAWISAGISFLVTPVFTRLYLPEEVGHINLFITYMTFFKTVCICALDQALMRFYNEKLEGLEKRTFLRHCLKINFTISVIVVMVIIVKYDFFSTQISGESNWLIPVCLSVDIVCSSFLGMSSISSRMEKNIFQYTLQVVSITFVEKVIFTLIAFYRAEYKLAILVMTCGYTILGAVFYFIKRKEKLLNSARIPWKTTKILLRFSIPYLPVLLLSWLNSSIPLFVLKKYVDYSAVGIYTNAVTIANILTIIQTGFTAYWGPFIYAHYKEENSREKIKKIERIVILVLISAAVCIVIFQDVIYLLVGEKFRASKTFFPFLMMTPICNAIADMTGIGIMLSKKSYLNIYTFIGNTFTNLSLSYVLVPRIGVMGAGIAVGISAFVMLIIRSYLGGRYYKICKSNWFIFGVVGMFILACVINIVFIDRIILKTLLLAAVFGGLCILFWKEIVYLVKFAFQEIKCVIQR